MKSSIVVCIVLCIMVVGIVIAMPSQSQSNVSLAENEYFRIHIRANSNSVEDQDVKYLIKDRLVSELTPLLANATTKDDAMKIVSNNLLLICDISNEVLASQGFNYKTRAEIKVENFPTRSYDTITLDSGYYDSLIVYLGEGVGDNWWCVVYPPLCFVGGENNDSNTVVYKSKLLDTIKNFFGGR